jgi:putative DNA primase/helicase
MTARTRRCCPLCARDEHDRTLILWDTGQVHCHRCGPDAWREIRDALRAAGDLPGFVPHGTAVDRMELERAREAARIERDKAHREAAIRAADIWGRSRPADRDHPYLVVKGIGRCGARQLGDRLVVPMRDTAGMLWSVQYIRPNGEKRFMQGGRAAGLYFSIGKPRSRIFVAEGFATAASCAELSLEAAACAFNSGNLRAVAQALQQARPNLEIVIVADNDAETAERIGRNPGILAARAAAAAVGCGIVIPEVIHSGP